MNPPKPHHGAPSLAGIVLAATGSLAQAAPQYFLTDLGSLGGSYANAAAINQAGQTAGSAHLPGNAGLRPWFWQEGTGLESLPGLGGSQAQALGLNDVGALVGLSRLSGESGPRGFHWKSGVIQALPTLGGSWGRATAVNGDGLVTGAASLTGDAAEHAFLWRQSSPGAAVDLGTLGGANSQGSAINAAGQIAGYAEDADGNTHASLWAAPYTALPLDLGTLGGTFSEAYAINADGQITGVSSDAGDTRFRGFVWRPGQGMADLGALTPTSTETAGLGINTAGDVAGYSTSASGTARRAIVRKSGAALTDLNGLILPGSGWVLTEARAINDAGQIVGIGTLTRTDPVSKSIRAEPRAFLLTPDRTPPQMTCPGAIKTAAAPAGLGTPQVSDNLDPAPQVANNAPAAFPAHALTTVTWTATDAAGNQASCAQSVTVVTPPTAPPVTPTPTPPTPDIPPPIVPPSVLPAPPQATANPNPDVASPALAAPTPQILSADLELSGSVQRPASKIRAQNKLTYRFLLTNLGTGPATQPQFSNLLNRRLRFVAAKPSAGTCQTPKRGHSGGQVVCRLPDLAPGRSESVDVTVIPKKRGTIQNSATASSAGTDTDPRNQVAELTVKVR